MSLGAEKLVTQSDAEGPFYFLQLMLVIPIP